MVNYFNFLIFSPRLSLALLTCRSYGAFILLIVIISILLLLLLLTGRCYAAQHFNSLFIDCYFISMKFFYLYNAYFI